MLSKEEIEEAKDNLLEIKEDFDWVLQHKSSRTNEEIALANKYSKAIETLLQYIEELETANIDLDRENNRLEKIETERDIANHTISDYIDTWRELKDKLQEDIKFARNEYKDTLNDRFDGIREEAQEILEILGGENE